MRTPDYSNQLARVGDKFLFAARVVRTSMKKGVRKGFVVFEGREIAVVRSPIGVWESAA